MKSILHFILLILNFIFITTKISELQKIKVRACMKLHSKKYQEEEEKITHFLEHMSQELKAEPKQILYISLAMCSKIIPDKFARVIHDASDELKLNKNNTLLTKIYDFEYYNYDDVEFIKNAYREFLPVFEVVREELKAQKDFFNGKFKLEFIHTPLFKLFFYYFIINTLIVFYKRIKNPPKVDKIIKDKEKEDNNKDNNKNEEEKNDKGENKSKSKKNKVE